MGTYFMQHLASFDSYFLNTTLLCFTTLKYALYVRRIAGVILKWIAIDSHLFYLLIVIRLQTDEIFSLDPFCQLYQSVVIYNALTLRSGHVFRRHIDAVNLIKLLHQAARGNIDLEQLCIN